MLGMVTISPALTASFFTVCFVHEVRERETDLLFHLSMHSLIDSYMCPDLGLNLQPWRIGTKL